MPERLGYVWEKLTGAVHGMAWSSRPIQHRIANAFIGNLVRLEVEDFPEDLQESFASINAKMTSVEAKGDEGSFMASALAMSDEEAEAVARTIVELADAVSARYTDFPNP